MSNLLNQRDSDILKDYIQVFNVQTNPLEWDAIVDMHVYDYSGQYLLTKHDFKDYILTRQYNDEVTIEFNYDNLVEDEVITYGKYIANFDFSKNILGSYKGGQVYIDEISPSRDEIKIRPKAWTLESNSDWLHLNTVNNRILKFVINLGDDIIIPITNYVYIDESDDIGSYILKLYNPLDSKYSVKGQLWIGELLADRITKNIELIKPKAEAKNYNSLAGPNFEVKVFPNSFTSNSENNSIQTFKTWDDILSLDPTTSSSLINKHISSSIQDSAELAIDYTSYDNFIHFGSAEEQVKNFYYKVNLIQLYEDQINWLAATTQSTEVVNNTSTYTLRKDTVINNLTPYENYLYYESASAYTDSFGVHYSDTYPKTTSYRPYELYHYSSASATNWLASQSLRAADYDLSNVHSLINVVPEYLKIIDYDDSVTIDLVTGSSTASVDNLVTINKSWNDSPSAEYISFVYMIGQYFDNHWAYINALTEKNKREDNINLGASKDVLYDIAQSLGWELNNGKDLVDLWKYTLGEQISGSWSGGEFNSGSWEESNTGKLTVSGSYETITGKEYTQEIWNRIINNLPYLLKNKGTKQGIRALLNCYGVPADILDIMEYGGPEVSGSLVNNYTTIDEVVYGPNFTEGDDCYFTVYHPYTNNRYVRTFEFRFKTSASVAEADEMSLLKYGDFNIRVKSSGSLDEGWAIMSSGSDEISSSKLPLFNDNYWNIMSTVNDNTASLYLCQTKDNEIDYIDSNSAIVSFDMFYSPTGSGDIRIGFYSGSAAFFTGSISEYRAWNIALTRSEITNHSKYIRSTHTTIGSQWDNLMQHYPFNTPSNLNPGDTPDLQSNCAPNLDKWSNIGYPQYDVVATPDSFPDVPDFPYQFDYEEIETRVLVPNIGGSRWNNNKIRIQDATLTNILDPEISVVDWDNYEVAKDSNKIGVYLSPTNLIDKDIINTYGSYSFDNLIGDPRDRFSGSYASLDTENESYFQKYKSRNNFQDYLRWIRIYDKSLFQQIKNLLPGRAKIQTGVLIKPHILERHPQKWRQVKQERLDYTSSINADTWKSASAEWNTYESLIKDEHTISSEYLTYRGTVDADEDSNFSSSSIALPTVIYAWDEFPELGAGFNDVNYRIWSIATSSITLTNGYVKKTISYYYKNYSIKEKCFYNYNKEKLIYGGSTQTSETTIDNTDPVEVFITSPNSLMVSKNTNNISTNLTVE